jgi:NitT/TauT family transport system ATP-binding protein
MSEVVLSKITKSHGNVRVLDDITFSIKSGEFVSIVGAYGTGKTTLLKVIAGILKQDSGAVKIDGSTPDVLLNERKIGFAFQDSSLLPWRSVMSNITLPLEINGEKQFQYAKELLKTVGLDDKAQAKPHELSGGMRRIVAILRALALKPNLLILDEPFSSIDEINRDNLHEKLITIHKTDRPTTIMVTHSVEEAVYLSDKVVLLGGSPARVVKIFNIKSPRQDKYSAETNRQVTKIRKTILELR